MIILEFELYPLGGFSQTYIYKSDGEKEKDIAYQAPSRPLFFEVWFCLRVLGVGVEALVRPAIPLGFGFLLCPPAKQKRAIQRK